ncbi:MAG: glycosyltransferase [Candidatus Kuenenia sp.]|nr:glycosyltransferase [Candidatus Kuenenia hertensis]
MKILYVYSDHKWTGPSQPIVELCNYMSRRADVMLLTSKPKVPDTGLISHVQSERLKTEQTLVKRGGIGALMKNRNIMKQVVQQFEPDIIHFFRDRDLAAHLGNSRKVVKIFTDFKVVPPGFLQRAIRKRADVVTVFSHKLRNNLQNDFRKVVYLNPWLDIHQIPKEPKNIRPEFGVKDEDFVVGLVMRVQHHRRFELVIEVAKLIKQSGINIKFLLLGRGPNLNKLAVEPVKKHKLEDIVIFGGYKRLDYWDAVHCFNVMFYTVAGSDGTARALRQCQAFGKPIICLVSDFVEEVVHDGVDGFVVRNDPKEIVEKLFILSSHKDMLTEFSKQSAAQGRKYDLENIGSEIFELYENCIKGRKPSK